MPYDIRRRGSTYNVVDENGKVVGRHKTRREALDHQRALYANVPDAKKFWNTFFPKRG